MLRGYLTLRKLLLIKAALGVLPLLMGLGFAGIFVHFGGGSGALLGFAIGVSLASILIGIGAAYFLYTFFVAYQSQDNPQRQYRY